MHSELVCDGGMNNMEAEVDWKADAKVAVLIWRVALVLLHVYEDEYCLPLDYGHWVRDRVRRLAHGHRLLTVPSGQW